VCLECLNEHSRDKPFYVCVTRSGSITLLAHSTPQSGKLRTIGAKCEQCGKYVQAVPVATQPNELRDTLLLVLHHGDCWNNYNSNHVSFCLTMAKRQKQPDPMGPVFEEEITEQPSEAGDRPKRSRETEGPSQTEAAIIDAANKIMHRSGYGSETLFDRRFRSHFGVSTQVAAFVWDLLQVHGDLPSEDEGATMERYLWGLMLMMCYCTEDVNCTLASGVDEQTFRAWAWFFVDHISFLDAEVVSLADCLLCFCRSLCT